MTRIIFLSSIVALLLMFPAYESMSVTSDGAHYLSVADNLAHGRKPLNYTGRLELDHPFGYSLALVPFAALGIPLTWCGFFVNWLSLVAIGLCAWLILRDMTGRDNWQVSLGAVLVVANPPAMAFNVSTLSETMAAALALLFAWVCLRLRGAA